MNREQWLAEAAQRLSALLTEHGWPMPAAYRVSCGFPSRGATRRNGRAIGQCHAPGLSADGASELFVSPVLADSLRVADVLLHEMIHAAVGVEHGHKAPFAKVAKAVGLQGKPTHTEASPELADRLNVLLADLGPYPHSALEVRGRSGKGSRLLKAQCPECDYIVRVTRVHADKGLPICPLDGVPFEIDGEGPDGPEDGPE